MHVKVGVGVGRDLTQGVCCKFEKSGVVTFLYLWVDSSHLKPDERICGQGESLSRHPFSVHSVTNYEIQINDHHLIRVM